MKLNSKKLVEHFKYNRQTGKLFWKKPTSNRVKIGYEVGSFTGRCLETCVYGKRLLVHRLIWFLVYKKFPREIDHIDGDATNNRMSNLREVSRKTNCKNQALRYTNTSGVLGVYWSKDRGKWTAQIMADAKTIYLGRYKDKRDAIKARKKANKLYGFHPNHGRSK